MIDGKSVLDGLLTNMRTKKIRLLCMTSDKYIHAVRPFLWLLEKYWYGCVLEVTVAGYSEPPFELKESGFIKPSFFSMGKFEDYPLSKWTDSFLVALEHMGDGLVIIMLEDYWVTRHVNVPAVMLAQQYMERYPKTLKFDLAADRLFAHGADLNFRKFGWLDVIKSQVGSPYHMSLMTGMWRTELLREVIVPGQNPWDVEIAGTTHLSKNFPDHEVVGSRQWPIKHTLAFRGGDIGKLLLGELEMEDVYSMRRLGFFKQWEEKDGT